MNRYEFPTPRVAFGFAALAMSALTIGVLVILPSRMESDSQAYALFAASRAAQCASALPAKCADVVGVEEPSLHAVSHRITEPRCPVQG